MNPRDLEDLFDWVSRHIPIVLFIAFWLVTMILKVGKRVRRAIEESLPPAPEAPSTAEAGPFARGAASAPPAGGPGPWNAPGSAGTHAASAPSAREMERAKPYRPIEPR